MLKSVKNPSDRQQIALEAFRLHRRLDWLDKRIEKTLAAKVESRKKLPLCVPILNKRLSEQRAVRAKLIARIKSVSPLQILALIE